MTVTTWKRKVPVAASIGVRADGDDLDIILHAKDGSIFAAGSFHVDNAIDFMRDIRSAVDVLRRKEIDLQ